MIRTATLACHLDRELADALNRQSGRIYTQVMVEHYRIYRQTGTWLSGRSAEKLNDFYNQDHPPLLHSHSIDAAQQGFYEACKTAKALKKTGDEQAKYPHWRKPFPTTTWKQTGIRLKAGVMLLALARGKAPIRVSLPQGLQIGAALCLEDHHR